MKFNELLRKIRTESSLKYSEMADKIGFSKGFISNVEKGKRGVSEKYLSALVKQFPLYEEELVKAYTEQKIPAIADNKIRFKFERNGLKLQVEFGNDDISNIIYNNFLTENQRNIRLGFCNCEKQRKTRRFLKV